MNLSPVTVLQVAILTAGIYAVLSFLRTTRGSGLVRGLTVTFVVGMIGLSVLATRLRLEELEYIIEIITGYVVVILVVLFQPELRRGIVQLGENPLVGRLLKARRQEVLTEVAKACVSMAKKRQGALIAFERKTSLDSFTSTAVPVDAEVNRFLLDSIFHHGSALHDGGVVLRGERIAAAACLFPLTENVEISRSTGTRHRAALGLTEETDAVAVAVSEETGSISICQGGKMHRNVSPAELEDRLRDLLGIDAAVEEARARARGRAGRLRRWTTENLGLKAGALVIAVGLYQVAHQELQGTRTFTIHFTTAASVAVEGASGQVVVALPDESYDLAYPAAAETFVVEVRGPRSRLGELDQRLSGLLELTAETLPASGEPLLLEPAQVRWDDEDGVRGLALAWQDEQPALVVQRFEEREFTLRPDMVPVEAELLDPRFEVSRSEISFSPTTVRVVGPAQAIERLGSPEEPLQFEPLRVREERTRVERALRLSERLRGLRFQLAGEEQVRVSLPIRPVRESIEVQREVALVSSDPTRPAAADSWLPPTETARLLIVTRGILPVDRSTPAYAERARNLRTWVDENVRVVIDVARIPEGSSRGTLELLGRRADPAEFDVEDPGASVEFELREPTTLLLTRRPDTDGGAAPPDEDS